MSLTVGSFRNIVKKGWFDDNGTKITTIEKGSFGNLTLNARWNAIQYTATFFADGIQIGTASFTVEDDKIANIPIIPDKRDCLLF